MESLQQGSLTGSQKEEIIEQVKQQVAVANAQELLNVRSLCEINLVLVFKSFYWDFNTYILFISENDGKMF